MLLTYTAPPHTHTRRSSPCLTDATGSWGGHQSLLAVLPAVCLDVLTVCCACVFRAYPFPVAFDRCCRRMMQLDDVWQAAASALRSRLLKALGPEVCSELHIIGRSRKQKVMLDAEHVTEVMQVAGRTYEYMQVRLAVAAAAAGNFACVLSNCLGLIRFL